MPEAKPRKEYAHPVWDGFYSAAQVSRLAGVPRSTLYDWKKRGTIGPSVQIFDGDRLLEEGYSYADLAVIKLLRGLKDKQLTRKSLIVALKHLFERFGSFDIRNWEQSHLFVLDKEVYAQKPDQWESTAATRGGQKLMLSLPDLFEEEAALLVPRDYSDCVEINPEVMDGQPVVKDTRIPTSTLAMMAKQGISSTELASLYSPVPADTIEKAIQYERSLDRIAA